MVIVNLVVVCVVKILNVSMNSAIWPKHRASKFKTHSKLKLPETCLSQELYVTLSCTAINRSLFSVAHFPFNAHFKLIFVHI